MSILPLNLPNVLTLARIVMVPVMVLLIVADETGALLAAAAVFGLAAVTDAADGHLARSRNLITKFGQVADPLADKLLVGAALVSLVAVERLALWVALVVLTREAAVSMLRWHASRDGIDLAVSGFGKAKTGAQMVVIPLLMLLPDTGSAAVAVIVSAMAAITAASGLDYALTYARTTSARRPVAATRW